MLAFDVSVKRFSALAKLFCSLYSLELFHGTFSFLTLQLSVEPLGSNDTPKLRHRQNATSKNLTETAVIAKEVVAAI